MTIGETTGIRYSVGPTKDGRLQIVISSFGVFDSPREVADYLLEQSEHLEKEAQYLHMKFNERDELPETKGQPVAA